MFVVEDIKMLAYITIFECMVLCLTYFFSKHIWTRNGVDPHFIYLICIELNTVVKEIIIKFNNNSSIDLFLVKVCKLYILRCVHD